MHEFNERTTAKDSGSAIPLPFGYDMKDGKIVIVEDEAEQDGRKRFNGHSESLVSERFLRRAWLRRRRL